ncbi:hypothetical protein K458DRAFT_410005 [Lentithecium fluviatile CBS 122367]|uniref:SnoaL-like domain-containing protein n=1 Tax=Lentithecium fluviatile CBS 122367 TaxID=1168545 RepID=A0A6G1IG45_9PLEO|nr:hypothetical protein K458DRAFT_410005 [Lentithecium fluviatile CBS 122367]
MATLKSAATAFTHSYANAMALSLQPTPSLTACAEAIASHYSPTFVAFALGGPPVKMQNLYPGATQADVVAKHLERFDKAGFGWRVKMVRFEVFVLSEEGGSAQCWITWEIEPRQACGVEAWRWTNVYGFRKGGGEGEGGGCWEYAVSDQEMKGLVDRCPGFFEL